MSSVLGKRKSRTKEPKEPTVSAEDAQEIFRRHFEAKFKPLPEEKKAKPEVADDSTDSDESESDPEWGGVSDEEQEDDEEQTVEIVDHTTSNSHNPAASMSKRELKAFMSSRPPTTDSPSTSLPPPPSAEDDDPEDERTLRAQDLALQRLLSESHLLASLNPDSVHSTAAAQKPFASGRLRHKTTDLRIQSLGSGNGNTPSTAGNTTSTKSAGSIYDQQKMPMAMRKRIVATKQAREDKRRREARENGVVLEREKKAAPVRAKRERAIDGPAVGRLKGAELKLSDRDVRSIEGGGGRGFGSARGRGGGKFGGGGKRGRR